MNIKNYIFQKAAKNHIPVSGTFKLTPRCNLFCEMCYIRMSQKEQSDAGSELTAGEWLTLGKKTVDAGMVYLLLTGGEPLLRRDFEEIYTGLAEMGVMLSLNTNGTLLNEKILCCMEHHPPEKVNVTLYGASPETYHTVCSSDSGFEAALRGIRMLKEAGISVCINTTYTRYNAADMEKLISISKNNHIPIRMTSYLFPPIRCTRDTNNSCFLTPEEYGCLAADFDMLTMTEEQKKRRIELLRQMKEMHAAGMFEEGRSVSCMAGRGSFWITWDGKLLPCGMLPSLSRDIRNLNFDEAWRSFDELMREQRLPRQCENCEKRTLCPVCMAVTQCTDSVPMELCRFSETYMKTMLYGLNSLCRDDKNG